MKSSVWYVLVVCGMSILILSNCKKEEESSFEPTCSSTYAYAQEVAPIIQKNCVSCHSNYRTYNGVAGDKSRIREEVVSGRMPQNGTLTEAEKNAIICWIDAEAEDN